MRIDYAPLEGITGFIYRNAFHKYYRGIDTYFAPFVSLGQGKRMTPKAKRDIAPENNQGITLVPQLLTNRADLFNKAVIELLDMGYDHVNLNLGCPSGTVVTKHKGAGFLEDPLTLQRFLDEIFENPKICISIKTRIGLEDESEFETLLPIYNQYPLEELIIHPRLKTDMYRNHPRMDVFAQAVKESSNPLCYNGDIFTTRDYEKFQCDFPRIDHIMLGRGLLRDPALAQKIQYGDSGSEETLRLFHDELYETYQREMSGERNVLFKMKEIWFYLSQGMEDGEKDLKHIRKAQHLSEYEVAVQKMFRNER